jgi:hypothetical protein
LDRKAQQYIKQVKEILGELDGSVGIIQFEEHKKELADSQSCRIPSNVQTGIMDSHVSQNFHS